MLSPDIGSVDCERMEGSSDILSRVIVFSSSIGTFSSSSSSESSSYPSSESFCSNEIPDSDVMFDLESID
ncbi:CLUMA_CG014808, isoform A [Clunio marinus]|uniref:CLUMA_CG014808, isoform A n=1 Tax=Clunio marinus TaxID=568069 RepID=A0A1J1ILU2_9DIPT|nr:CLUMA_CG014808, isoform A [Clunio marinus]